jgi:L-threonylcarbamoyladenylate synthase
MIENLLEVKVRFSDSITNNIKVPGLLSSHYSPDTPVIINGIPKKGDGFIALAYIPTPIGVIRIASPENNAEFARVLYRSFRIADSLMVNNLIVVPPKSSDIGVAINDRLIKAQFKQVH